MKALQRPESPPMDWIMITANGSPWTPVTQLGVCCWTKKRQLHHRIEQKRMQVLRASHAE